MTTTGSLTITSTDEPGLSPGQTVDVTIDSTVQVDIHSTVSVTAIPAPEPTPITPADASAS